MGLVNFNSIIDTKNMVVSFVNKDKENLLEIDYDGNIFIGKDLLKIDSDKELVIGFCLVISDLTGIEFSNQNKDEFVGKMVQYFRERQINKIL